MSVGVLDVVGDSTREETAMRAHVDVLQRDQSLAQRREDAHQLHRRQISRRAAVLVEAGLRDLDAARILAGEEA